jgi:hypothetical protein
MGMSRLSDTTPARADLNTRRAGWTRREALRTGVAAAAWLAAPASAALSADDTLAPGPLFDGRSLGQWKPIDFGGQGEVRIEDGAMVLERGNDLTGVVWTGLLPGPSYTLSLEAMRLDGVDFFCALTFPVGGSYVSYVVGGWGGSLIGISSLEGFDAAENETSTVRRLEDRRWYRLAVAVTPERLRAALDDEWLIDLALAGRDLDVRVEVEACRPLGIASYRTVAAIRNIRLD